TRSLYVSRHFPLAAYFPDRISRLAVDVTMFYVGGPWDGWGHGSYPEDDDGFPFGFEASPMFSRPRYKTRAAVPVEDLLFEVPQAYAHPAYPAPRTAHPPAAHGAVPAYTSAYRSQPPPPHLPSRLRHHPHHPFTAAGHPHFPTPPTASSSSYHHYHPAVQPSTPPQPQPHPAAASSSSSLPYGTRPRFVVRSAPAQTGTPTAAAAEPFFSSDLPYDKDDEEYNSRCPYPYHGLHKAEGDVDVGTHAAEAAGDDEGDEAQQPPQQHQQQQQRRRSPDHHTPAPPPAQPVWLYDPLTGICFKAAVAEPHSASATSATSTSAASTAARQPTLRSNNNAQKPTSQQQKQPAAVTSASGAARVGGGGGDVAAPSGGGGRCPTRIQVRMAQDAPSDNPPHQGTATATSAASAPTRRTSKPASAASTAAAAPATSATTLASGGGSCPPLDRQGSTAIVTRPAMEVALSRGPSAVLPSAAAAAAAPGSATTGTTAPPASAATAAAAAAAKPPPSAGKSDST
ncbi:hypothetical protein Agub_g14768, partial [Astrephomene gubernaculifera]